jgi:glutathione S-transferase
LAVFKERSMAGIRIVGSYLSPYVRKVLAQLHLKGLDYEIDPIVPFFGGDEFSRLSPLRRIPVLIDADVTLSDSTVIGEYLNERYGGVQLLPSNLVDRARARWLEEYADTRIGEIVIWKLYQQLAINRRVWGLTPDEQIVAEARDHDIPHILDYLETQVPASGFLFGDVMTADIALATFFRNAGFVRYTIDAARWPVTAAYVDRVLDHPCLASLRPFEELCLKTPPSSHREALREAGVQISTITVGSDAPRRGIMKI